MKKTKIIKPTMKSISKLTPKARNQVSRASRKVLALRAKHFTYARIGRELGVSLERARQLVVEANRGYCAHHDIYYEKKCPYCPIEQRVSSLVKWGSKAQLISELARLGKDRRVKPSIIKRRIIVRCLHDKYGLTFSQLGKIAKRHWSTMFNLYKKTPKELKQ